MGKGFLGTILTNIKVQIYRQSQKMCRGPETLRIDMREPLNCLILLTQWFFMPAITVGYASQNGTLIAILIIEVVNHVDSH